MFTVYYLFLSSFLLYSLKNTISKLQQGMRENKIKLHQVIMSNAQEHGGSAMEEKLQVHTCI